MIAYLRQGDNYAARSHIVRPMHDEAAFRALADANRRILLDRLFERDGQALEELEAALPGMTRFGVMKHLRVLEAAGLVTTRRAGRRKLHFLNPVPIRLIHDRWISKYAEPFVGGMADLKHTLEGPMSSPKHVYEVYVQTTPEELFLAECPGEEPPLVYDRSGVDDVGAWKGGFREDPGRRGTGSHRAARPRGDADARGCRRKRRRCNARVRAVDFPGGERRRHRDPHMRSRALRAIGRAQCDDP